MRSKHFLGFLTVGVAATVIAAGCGDGGSSGTGGAGGTTSSSVGPTSVVSSGGPTVTVTASSGAGGGPDANVSCMTGKDIALAVGEMSTLEPVADDEDFYRFTGTAGQAILILTDSKPPTDEFDVSYPDVVITVYDANGIQIAENDDPFPRNTNDASLYTVLPADGSYCVRVTECNIWAGVGAGCAPSSGITITDYTLFVDTVDPALDSIVAEAEPNDMPPMGTSMEYAKNMGGQYYLSLAYGTYASATDVDVYAFNIPMDWPVQSGRALCNFDFYPGGPSGSGSTAVTQVLAYMTTAADPLTKIAEVDVTAGAAPAAISMPCTFGTDYLFFMTRPAGATPDANDFYFINHAGSGSNPVEMEPNDTVQTAEVLTPQMNPDGSVSYFIDGDITMMPADRDHFSVDTTGMATVSVACGAQRSGSGLRSFTATLLDGTGMPITGATATETASMDVRIQNITIPSGSATITLQAEAMMQAPDVTSNSYRCGVHLAP